MGHLYCSMNQHLILMAKWYSVTLNIPPLFIQSSVDSNLGCFYLLGIVNNIAQNISVQASVSFQFSWSFQLGVELLGVFEELLNCSPKWSNHFTFPSAVYEGPNLSVSSGYYILLIYTQSRWYEEMLYV